MISSDNKKLMTALERETEQYTPYASYITAGLNHDCKICANRLKALTTPAGSITSLPACFLFGLNINMLKQSSWCDNFKLIRSES